MTDIRKPNKVMCKCGYRFPDIVIKYPNLNEDELLAIIYMCCPVCGITLTQECKGQRVN
jgi:hypothetical protein